MKAEYDRTSYSVAIKTSDTALGEVSSDMNNLGKIIFTIGRKTIFNRLEVEKLLNSIVFSFCVYVIGVMCSILVQT